MATKQTNVNGMDVIEMRKMIPRLEQEAARARALADGADTDVERVAFTIRAVKLERSADKLKRSVAPAFVQPDPLPDDDFDGEEYLDDLNADVNASYDQNGEKPKTRECLHPECPDRVVSEGYCSTHSDNIKTWNHPDGQYGCRPLPKSLKHIMISAAPLAQVVQQRGGVRPALRKGLTKNESDALEHRISRAIKRETVSMEAADYISIKGFGINPETLWGDEWWDVDDRYLPVALPGSEPEQLSINETKRSELSEQIVNSIEGYTPRKVEGDIYELFSDFLIAAVKKTMPNTRESAIARMSSGTNFVLFLYNTGLWTHYANYQPPFTPKLIDAFLKSDGERTESSLRTMNSHLVSIGRTLHPDVWSMKRRTKECDRAPFVALEQECLWSAASKMRHESDDLRAVALVAGSLGAGLASSDFIGMKGSDVTKNSDGVVCVNVGGKRERVVPVSEPWADRMYAVASRTGKRYLVGGTENDVRSLQQELSRENLNVMSTQKMRNTWITERVNDGYTNDTLREMSGVKEPVAAHHIGW